jgi:hypothetical protein
MKESVTYQAIVEEGRVEEARRMLLRIGTAQFGSQPTPEQLHELEAVTDVGRLEKLGVRLLEVLVGTTDVAFRTKAPPTQEVLIVSPHSIR